MQTLCNLLYHTGTAQLCMQNQHSPGVTALSAPSLTASSRPCHASWQPSNLSAKRHAFNLSPGSTP